jgi:hypothetical protein
MPEDPPALSVAEIGSFFVGGHIHRLEGLAKRERISTPGGRVHFIDPNGELSRSAHLLDSLPAGSGTLAR